MNKFYVYFIFFLFASHSYLLNTCNAADVQQYIGRGVDYVKAVPNEYKLSVWLQEKIGELKNEIFNIINSNNESKMTDKKNSASSLDKTFSRNLAILTAIQQEFTEEKIKHYFHHTEKELSQIYLNIEQSETDIMKKMIINLHLISSMTTIFMNGDITMNNDLNSIDSKKQFEDEVKKTKTEIEEVFKTSFKKIYDGLSFEYDDLKIFILTTYALTDKINSFLSAYGEINTKSEVASKEFDEFRKLVDYDPNNKNIQKYNKLIDLCFEKAEFAFKKVVSEIEINCTANDDVMKRFTVRKEGIFAALPMEYEWDATEEEKDKEKDEAKKSIFTALMKRFTFAKETKKSIFTTLIKRFMAADDVVAAKCIFMEQMNFFRPTDKVLINELDAREEALAMKYKLNATKETLDVLLQLLVIFMRGTTKSQTYVIMELLALLANDSADITRNYYEKLVSQVNEPDEDHQAQQEATKEEKDKALATTNELLALLAKDSTDVILANNDEAKKNLLAALIKTLAVTNDAADDAADKAADDALATINKLDATDDALAPTNELLATDKALALIMHLIVTHVPVCSRVSHQVFCRLANNDEANAKENIFAMLIKTLAVTHYFLYNLINKDRG